jgi:aryl-alcohol dehydrogenase
MRITAAVLRERGGRFTPEDVQLDLGGLQATEVCVALSATGLCHTDLAARDGHLPVALPAILGHEGAGVIVAIGAAVRSVAIGDHVVLCPAACEVCGSCRSGHPSYCREMVRLNMPGPRPDGSYPHRDATGAPINGGFFGQSSLATHCLAHESNVVKVDRDLPLDLLGPLGCGLQTGAGTVLNALRPGPGDAIAVFGSGPVGLAAVMAARASGCTIVIAVDINPQRLETARDLGATHVLDSREGDVTARIVEDICPAGLDGSIETTGRNDVIHHAVGVLGPRGRCALVAVPSSPQLELPWSVMTAGRSVTFVQEGDSVPHLFIPRLIGLYRAGVFPFDRLIQYYDLANVGQAVEDFEHGRVIKAVVRMPRP